MRGLLLLLVGYAALVPSLKAQSTNGGSITVGDNSSATITYISTAAVNLSGLDDVRDACIAVANAVSGFNNNMQSGFFPLFNQMITNQVQQSLIQLSNTTASVAAVSNLTAELNAIKLAISVNSGFVATNTLALNNLAGINVVVSNAINSVGTYTAMALTQGLGWKLDVLTDVVRTNQANITVNSTNGALNLTNNISVTVPSMANTESNSWLTILQAGMMLPAALTPYTNPDIVGAQTEANISQPVPNASIGGAMALVLPGGFTPHFLKLELPKPPGAEGTAEEWTIDLNPVTWRNGTLTPYFAWFRAAVAWAATILFLRKCADQAEKFLLRMFQQAQLAAPNFQVNGNSIGKLSVTVYYGIYMGAAVIFQTALTQYLTGATGLGFYFGQNASGLANALGLLTQNPLDGMAPDILLLLDYVFPLGLLLSQFLFLLTSRFWLWNAWWLWNIVIKRLPT